jgi:hypothetical protein
LIQDAHFVNPIVEGDIVFVELREDPGPKTGQQDLDAAGIEEPLAEVRFDPKPIVFVVAEPFGPDRDEFEPGTEREGVCDRAARRLIGGDGDDEDRIPIALDQDVDEVALPLICSDDVERARWEVQQDQVRCRCELQRDPLERRLHRFFIARCVQVEHTDPDRGVLIRGGL